MAFLLKEHMVILYINIQFMNKMCKSSKIASLKDMCELFVLQRVCLHSCCRKYIANTPIYNSIFVEERGIPPSLLLVLPKLLMEIHNAQFLPYKEVTHKF